MSTLTPSTDEEQTLRSVKAPQRIRMSLRMRRMAAGPSHDQGAALQVNDRVGVRLAGQSFELAPGQECIAGRSSECEIPVTDRLCSRRHAAFARAADGTVVIRDLGSTNGTYVNGVRILAPHRAARGDWVTIGNETLELCVTAAAQRVQTSTIPAGRRRAGSVGRGRPDRAAAQTDPGSPLLSLASFAATAAGKTPNPEVVRTPLDALLRQTEQGKEIHEPDARMAALVALHMARATSDASWLEYAFRLYSALRLPLPAELIERLSEALEQLSLPTTSSFAAYLELLRQTDPAARDETQRQLIARLAKLHTRS